MWEQTDGTSNLPVSIKHIHSFKRMHRYQPYEAVVAALRDSAFLDVIGEEGEEKVKRKVAYDPAWSKSDEAKKRSIYAKGFGDEEPSSQFDIEAFFTTYGPTNRVILRRHKDKLFKGSVFVEFHDEKTAEAFLKLDPKPLWKGKHELEIKPKAEYMAGKNEEINNGTLVPKESWGPDRSRGGQYRGRGRGRGNDRNGRGGRDYDRRDRGDRDPDDWKKRREEDRASGFKDPRGNRKDRGHNKGGRGGRRDDRGPRNNDRNRERDGYDELLILFLQRTNNFLVTRKTRPSRARTPLPRTSRPKSLPPSRKKRPPPSRTTRSVPAKMTMARAAQPRRSIASLKFLLKPHDTLLCVSSLHALSRLYVPFGVPAWP